MATEIFKLVGRVTYEGQKVVEKGLTNLDKKLKTAQKAMSRFDQRAQAAGRMIKDFGKTTADVGNKLTRNITMPVAALGTALAGLTIAKGLDRLIGIDTAQAKLKALGHDAQNVELIMDSALTSVKGTAFGLGDAATTAANAVAAGIEPGKELTRYLTITADAAAIAGAGLGEMGSIINKVTTSGKAYNGELQMLADRGLPIYQWLAEEANTTADAVFDMASKGEISSAMLLSAIENNIGGAAQIMGEESFTAAVDNMWAAVGRLGAAFLDAGGKGGGFFSQVKPILTEITNGLDNMGGMAEAAGVKFGQFFANTVQKIRDAKKWFDDLDPSIQELITKVVTFGSIGVVSIGPFLTITGKMAMNIGALIEIFGKVGLAAMGWTTVIGLVIAALVYAYTQFEWFRDGVHAAFQYISDLVTPIILDFTEFFKAKIAEIKAWWDENGAMIQQAFHNVFNFIAEVIKTVVNIALPIVQGFINGIKNIISGGLDVVLGVVEFFAALFTGNWSKMGDAAKRIIQGALQLIWGLFQTNLLGRVVSIITRFGSRALSLFKGMGANVTNFVSGFVSKIVNFFKSMGETAALRVMYGFDKIKNNIMKPIRAAADFVKKQVDRIKNFFSNLKIKFPKIKLPRFKLSGEFSLMPPKVPKISVDWYKKGGIFGAPNIIGVGEEPGVSEAVIPLKSNILAKIGEGIARATGGIITGGIKPQTFEERTYNDNRVIHMTIDAGNMEELQRVIELFTGLRQNVRQG